MTEKNIEFWIRVTAGLIAIVGSLLSLNLIGVI